MSDISSGAQAINPSKQMTKILTEAKFQQQQYRTTYKSHLPHIPLPPLPKEPVHQLSSGVKSLAQSTIQAKNKAMNSPLIKEPKLKKMKRDYVFSRLTELGLNIFELIRLEAHYLPTLLMPGEQINGVTVGRSKKGHIMVVATDRRIIVLDRKPFISDVESMTYLMVTGVSVAGVGFLHSVTLHTRAEDIHMKTLYSRAAYKFKDYVNQHCIEISKNARNNLSNSNAAHF